MTYRTGQKSFTDFIILYPQFRNSNGSILPASQSALLEWVAWLGGIRRIQPKTIKSYITHLRSAHVDADLPFSACESPLLQCIIQGIKRYMGEHCNMLMHSLQRRVVENRLVFERSLLPRQFLGS